MGKFVAEILARKWDPLGVVARGGFLDEYDSYAKEICGMLKRGEGVTAISAYLEAVERKQMLQTPNHQRAHRVSFLIVESAQCLLRHGSGN